MPYKIKKSYRLTFSSHVSKEELFEALKKIYIDSQNPAPDIEIVCEDALLERPTEEMRKELVAIRRELSMRRPSGTMNTSVKTKAQSLYIHLATHGLI